MKKVRFLIFLIILFISVEAFAQKNSPNIIVFIADDAGMDFGCYGNKGVKTPNVDKLAKEGLIFNNAFLTASQCSPSRTSILAGKFAHTLGTEDLHVDLDNSTRIIPWYLQQAGYYTGIMLKTHIGLSGVEQFNWYDHSYKDQFTGVWDSTYIHHFKNFLELTKEKPFFLWVGFMDPHRPYNDEIRSAPVVYEANDVQVPPYLLDKPLTRKDLARYYDHVSRMDTKIGGMLEELESRGLDDNTVIIFLSDNGMPFPRAKATVYDSGIQTPLLITWPGHIKPDTEYNELVSVIDLAPTILDIANVEIPKDMYGNSIQKLFYDQSLPGSKYIFAERNHHGSDGHIRCIRSENYKLIFNFYTDQRYPVTGDYQDAWKDLQEGFEKGTLTHAQSGLFRKPWPMLEFYDLKQDPYETVNLFENQETIPIPGDMLEAFYTWQKETMDYPSYLPNPNPNAHRNTKAQWMKWIQSIKSK